MECGWITTLRRDGSPRLARVWFVEVVDEVWIASGESSLKVADVRRDGRVAFAVEGRHTVVYGVAAIVPVDSEPEVCSLFAARYQGWDLSDPTVDGQRVLIRLRPAGR